MLGISRQEIDRYNEKYAAFEKAVEAFFVTLNRKVTEVSCVVGIDYFIDNVGASTAERLRVEATLEGDAVIVLRRELMGRSSDEIWTLPKPPREPAPWNAGLRPL